MATSAAYKEIVPETLTKDNYDNWSILVKNYLMSQGLWVDVIEGGENAKESSATAPENATTESSTRAPESATTGSSTTAPENANESSTTAFQSQGTAEPSLEMKIKNARALHIIQISCGTETLSRIKETDTAKSAWNTLASLYKSKLRAKADIEQGLTPLHRGVQRGDWDAARTFLYNDRKAIYETSELGMTVLHIAVLTGQDNMVKKLATDVPKRLLLERDTKGYTALALAADLSDDTSIAECMVTRSKELLTIETNEGLLPVVLAASRGNKKMANYLYDNTKDVLNKDNGDTTAVLLTRCITSEIFDVALDLLQRNPRLPLDKKFDGVSPLYALSQQPTAFPSVSPPKFWQRWLYDAITHDDEHEHPINIRLQINQDEGGKYSISDLLSLLSRHLLIPVLKVFLLLLGMKEIYKKIYKKKRTHFQAVAILSSMAKGIMGFDEAKLKEGLVYESLLEASKSGIAEFIILMTQANPDLYWVMDENQRGIFSYAVLNRREKIFNLIYNLKGQGKAIISRIDIFGNNMLHFTGILAPAAELDRKSGPALQMQRELQWFKAVRRNLHPKFQQAVNGDGMKPQELFTKKHEKLMKDGEKWAKETATSFTIVGTLIITIMFAAAFTLPGGNDQTTGIPIFLHKRMFTVYIVADAISLFASSTSVMTFIGILTSRYAERDFLISLPRKLMIGLFTLICSVLAMMVAFCSALSLMLRDRGHFKVVVVAICIASLCVLIFLPFQFRLLLEIFNSTYRSEKLKKKI